MNCLPGLGERAGRSGGLRRPKYLIARVDRIVYGAPDPKAGAAGSLWDVVRDRRLNWRPEVIGGVREQECSALLTDFFAGRRLR